MKKILIAMSVFAVLIFTATSFRAKTEDEIAKEKDAIESKKFHRARVYTPLYYHFKKGQGDELVRAWKYTLNRYHWYLYNGGMSLLYIYDSDWYYQEGNDVDILWDCPPYPNGLHICGVQALPIDNDGHPDLSTALDWRTWEPG